MSREIEGSTMEPACPECHVPSEDAFHAPDCSRRRLNVLENWCESLEKRILTMEQWCQPHEH